MKKVDNYRSNLAVLEQAGSQDLTNEFIQGGVINKFHLQFELGWKMFKALLAYEGAGISASGSPRDIIKAAYRYFALLDEETWLQMLRDRNDTTHIYEKARAESLIEAVITRYVPEFQHVLAAVEAYRTKSVSTEGPSMQVGGPFSLL